MSDQTDSTYSEGHFGEKENHPSYATISVSRVSGGAVLFGSSIVHNEYVSIRIGTASVERALSNDWVHGGVKDLIEVAMSPVQFAEFVSGFGIGRGTPCTLQYVNGERIPQPKLRHIRAMHDKEFRDKMRNIAANLDDLQKYADSLQDKPSVTKADRAKLVEKIRHAKQEIAGNMPFVAEQFSERIEKTISEAKGEIDAHLTRMVVETGLEVLRKPIALEEK